MRQALTFKSIHYYDYISTYGTLFLSPQPPWRLGLLLSVVLPRSRALPIPACLRRETQNFLHAVAFTRDSHRSAGRCDRYRSTIDYRSINDQSDSLIDRWLIDDVLDRSMVGRLSC